MNNDDQHVENKSGKIPPETEQCDDYELKIKQLEEKRDKLKKEQMKKRIQELEQEVDLISQTASEQIQTTPQMSSNIQRPVDCQVQVENGIRNLTKEIDRKNDCKLQISPHANWGNLLTPAPMAILQLANLYFISANVDFNLKSQMPIGGFKYLKYPDSFKACLVQISNSGWHAFNEAHTCMDQIRLMSGSVDTHVREAINIILEGTALEVEKCLPHVLKTIDEIANESLELAKQIEANFSHVMDLTGELYEVSTSKGAAYEENVKQIKAEKTDIELSLKYEEQQQEQHEKRLKNMEKRVLDEQKKYEKAVSAQPGALSILGISLAEGLVDSVRNITSLPAEIVRGLGHGTYEIAGKIIQRTKEPNGEDTKSLERRTAEFYLMSYVHSIDASLDNLLGILYQYACAGATEESKGEIDVCKSNFSRHQDYISGGADCGELSEDMSLVCKTGKEICIILADSISSITTIDKQMIPENIQRCNKLKQKTIELKIKHKKEQGRNPLDERPPCLPQRPIPASTSALATVMENARYNIEFAKSSFEDIQKKHELAQEQVDKNAKIIFEATKKMETLKIEDVDFATLKSQLQDGIAVLGEVRAQWANLIMFFREISNLIKCCMNTSLKSFVKTVSSRAELKAAGDLMSKGFRANMYDQTLEASRISFVVCDMATSYVDVSSMHIMPGVNLLQKFIGLNSIKHESEMNSTMEELRQVCKEAQTSICSKIKQQHQELKEQTERRMIQMQQELDVLILPIENQKSIEDAVHRVFAING